MSYTLQRHFDYNVWANEQLLKVLEPLDESLFHVELKSSFASLAKTLLHMRDAEMVWLKRLQGTSLSQWPSELFTGGKTELLKAFIAVSHDFQRHVHALTDEDLQAVVAYKSVAGAPFENVVEDLLYHVINHATYHRGQVTTLLRELGVTKPANTDLITYLRIKK